MRAIRELNSFKRDLKRISSNIHYRGIRDLLAPVLRDLAADKPLDVRYRDHPLSGEWLGSRDCHLKFDLVLIYRKHGKDWLELVRLGEHHNIFGD